MQKLLIYAMHRKIGTCHTCLEQQLLEITKNFFVSPFRNRGEKKEDKNDAVNCKVFWVTRKRNNKDTRTAFMKVVLVSLFLTLNRYLPTELKNYCAPLMLFWLLSSKL